MQSLQRNAELRQQIEKILEISAPLRSPQDRIAEHALGHRLQLIHIHASHGISPACGTSARTSDTTTRRAAPRTRSTCNTRTSSARRAQGTRTSSARNTREIIPLELL